MADISTTLRRQAGVTRQVSPTDPTLGFGITGAERPASKL